MFLKIWDVIIKNIIIDTLETVLVAMAVFLILQTLVAGSRVEGSSMETSLPHNSYVLINKMRYLQPVFWTTSSSRVNDSTYLFDAPKRGEIIVFHSPYPNNPDYVKRVIAVPGETISIKNGTILVNDRPLEEPYITNKSVSNMQPTIIPPGEIFVLGDNRSYSEDSRSFGPISRESIIGKVWFIVWPLNSKLK